MASPLRFDDRVVLVTGAGGGLGREYALAFADRGAKVVVNDLGGSSHGSGESLTAADRVVAEIRQRGGTAVPNYDSVEDGQKVVATAIDNFGRIDVLVNNAGILRDKSFVNMTTTDWDLIHRVHLRGSFMVTKAAWPHMRKQKYGRIIMTSSSSGLYGNFGQANYSAAKMGLVGLSSTLSLEGSKYNIHCNSIVPYAASRLTQETFTPDMFDAMQPVFVAPVVLYLCHESCQETGGIIEAATGWASKVKLFKTEGAVMRSKSEAITPEKVRDNWATITDFKKGNVIECDGGSASAFGPLAQIIDDINNGRKKSRKTFPKKILNTNDLGASTIIEPATDQLGALIEHQFQVTPDKVLLYNLSIGATPNHQDDLKFLYEYHDSFCALPTYAVVPSTPNPSESWLFSHSKVPQFDLSQIVHGEQYVELFHPIPTEGTMTNRGRVVEVMDKGSGAVIVVNNDTFDQSGKHISFSQSCVFIVGGGGFGGPRQSLKAKPLAAHPARPADAEISEKTRFDQAALYRLNGDHNPLHIDPSFAKIAGFDQPILHGLCSFGFSVRHVMAKFAGNDPTLIRAMKTRFAKPVLPGQTIKTLMWKEGLRIHFETEIVETNAKILTGGYVDLVSDAALPTTPSAAKTGTSVVHISDQVFEGMRFLAESQPGLARSINGVFLWKVTEEDNTVKEWTLDFKHEGKIYPGTPRQGKADTTIFLSARDLEALVSGTVDAQKLYFTGKLKMTGNIMLTQKLEKLFKAHAKL